MLRKCGAKIGPDLPDSFMERPIQHACQFQELELVKTLLKEFHVDAAAKDGDGRNLLHISVYSDQPDLELVKYLTTSVNPRMLHQRDEAGALPLHLAILTNASSDLNVIKFLMDHVEKSELSSPGGNFTALGLAAQRELPSVVSRLLELGADPNVACNYNDYNVIPLDIAIRSGPTDRANECIKLLLSSTRMATLERLHCQRTKHRSVRSLRLDLNLPTEDQESEDESNELDLEGADPFRNAFMQKNYQALDLLLDTYDPDKFKIQSRAIHPTKSCGPDTGEENLNCQPDQSYTHQTVLHTFLRTGRSRWIDERFFKLVKKFVESQKSSLNGSLEDQVYPALHGVLHQKSEAELWPAIVDYLVDNGARLDSESAFSDIFDCGAYGLVLLIKKGLLHPEHLCREDRLARLVPCIRHCNLWATFYLVMFICLKCIPFSDNSKSALERFIVKQEEIAGRNSHTGGRGPPTFKLAKLIRQELIGQARQPRSLTFLARASARQWFLERDGGVNFTLLFRRKAWKDVIPVMIQDHMLFQDLSYEDISECLRTECQEDSWMDGEGFFPIVAQIEMVANWHDSDSDSSESDD